MPHCRHCHRIYMRHWRKERRERGRLPKVRRILTASPIKLEADFDALVKHYGGWDRLMDELPGPEAARIAARILRAIGERTKPRRVLIDDDLIDCAAEILLQAGWSIRPPGAKQFRRRKRCS